jgi:hypothetical protein
MGELVQASRERVTLTAKRMPSLAVDHVLKLISSANPHKATGLDGVTIATWQAGGLEAAELATAVLNSSRQHAKAPVKLKGGRIQDVYKGKGEKKDTNNSRGLLIQPFLGKLHGGLLKDDIDPIYRGSLPDTQCGAVGGKSAGMASLTSELHADLARSRGLSSGRFFIYLKVVFDSVVRGLALLSADDSPDRVQAVVVAHNPPSEFCKVLLSFLGNGGGGVLDYAGTSSELLAMFNDLRN